jgi:hypothetical protein
MSGVASDLLALARALAFRQVTPAEAADRLIILAHRVYVSAAQAEEVSPVQDEMSAPPTPGDEEA